MLQSIELDLAKRLRADPEFRREWFRTELELGVPDQFRGLREERKLTQAKLAEKADMKQSAISRFEKSTDATWNFETLLKLAEALDAQLQIRVVKAEDAIRRIELEETATKAASVRAAITKVAENAKEEHSALLATIEAAKRALSRPSLSSQRNDILLVQGNTVRAMEAKTKTEDTVEPSKGLQDGSNWLQRHDPYRAIQHSTP